MVVRELERLAADGWPPLEQVEVDGWRLRASQGVTRRGNSALPLSDARPLDAVRAFYAERGLPPLVQVADDALDAELDALGWRREMPTQVMTGPLPPPADGEVAPAPDEEWLTCWWAVDGRGGPEALDVAGRCLARIAVPAAYARVRVDGRTVAVGRGVAHEGRLGVFSMAVLPEHRRRGHGARVLGALAAWGAAHGATSTYLQVVAENAAAVGLYAGAGLVRSHGYCYRYGPGA